jgi:hypothetical protein
MPGVDWAVGVLLLRFGISQMDVPTRQAYTMAVVRPDERSVAAGVTGVARSMRVAPAATGPTGAGATRSPSPRDPRLQISKSCDDKTDRTRLQNPELEG